MRDDAASQRISSLHAELESKSAECAQHSADGAAVRNRLAREAQAQRADFTAQLADAERRTEELRQTVAAKEQRLQEQAEATRALLRRLHSTALRDSE